MMEKTVTDADEGIRLDRWFKRHCPNVPHGLLEKHLRKGLVRLDRKKTQSSARIASGQVISFPEEFLQASDRAPQKKKQTSRLSDTQIEQMQRMVIYRDTNIIIINKPAGLAVQGGTGIKDSVDARLDALRFDSPERPKLVHRLDKDTSGVLVLARSAKAAAKLMQAFANKPSERSSGVRSEPEQRLQKIYWALVVGVPKPEEGKIDMPLAKSEGDYERVEADEEGKRAVTHYRVLERLADKMAHMELMPITGRTHQLRVHMAEIGCPILGDGKYGGQEAFISGMELSKQLHLHARRIIIPEIFGKVIDVSAPLPEHMAESFKALGL